MLYNSLFLLCCDHDQVTRFSSPSTRNSHNQSHVEAICDAGWAHQDPNSSHEQNVGPSRASGLHGVHLGSQHFLALGSCSFLCLLVAARLWLGILIHCCFAEQRRVVELEELRTRQVSASALERRLAAETSGESLHLRTWPRRKRNTNS